jgi:uncharacterized repeat protein (TIGR03803 family)
MRFRKSSSKLRLIGVIALATTALVTSSRSSHAAILTPLYLFTGSDGANPAGGLTLSGSTFYGTTKTGGANGDGTVFSIPITGGTPTTLYSFAGTDGANPIAGLTLSGSTLYGTTNNGGANGDGTVFSIPASGGTPTTLFSFDGAQHGANPGYLTLSPDGSTLYGTTYAGGAHGDGTVFSIPVTGGTPSNLFSFYLANNQGANPEGSLTLNGTTLYGTTSAGGKDNQGTVFSIPVTGGTLTTLSTFPFPDGTHGGQPGAGLTLSGSTLFGTTVRGGTNGQGTVFSVPITGGTPTTLFSFDPNQSGAEPNGLMLSGSTLFGTTGLGGADNGQGTVFSIPVNGGTLTTLSTFPLVNGGSPAAPDGSIPSGMLTLSGSTLYGTAQIGGVHGDGAVFALLIPEPSSFILLLVGSAVTAFWCYRRSAPRQRWSA